MRVKCAAILYEGKIYEGISHCDIGFDMLKRKVCNRPYPGGDAQGFVTECGKFVSREEALEIAIAARQVKRGQTTNNNQLFSEDIRGVNE